MPCADIALFYFFEGTIGVECTNYIWLGGEGIDIGRNKNDQKDNLDTKQLVK